MGKVFRLMNRRLMWLSKKGKFKIEVKSTNLKTMPVTLVNNNGLLRGITIIRTKRPLKARPRDLIPPNPTHPEPFCMPNVRFQPYLFLLSSNVILQ